MISLLIKYKYVYCFYLLHKEPCNVDVANKHYYYYYYYIGQNNEVSSADNLRSKCTPCGWS